MRTQLQKRLEALRAEYDSGRRVLAELEARRAGLEQTLLRISGAIQVLQEELGNDEKPEGHDGQPQHVIKPLAQVR